MRSVILCVGLVTGFALIGWGADPDGHLVDVGGHKLFVQCTGRSSEMTVVLENGLGAGLDLERSSVEGGRVLKGLQLRPRRRGAQ
jgi:hypothetical protein